MGADRLHVGGPRVDEGDVLPGAGQVSADVPADGSGADTAIALIDLDQAGTGPAAADIGSLLARLHQDGDTGEMRAAFLSGYRTVRALPPEGSLRWHTAASVLARVAVPAVGRVRPAALARLGPLLRAAEELAA